MGLGCKGCEHTTACSPWRRWLCPQRGAWPRSPCLFAEEGHRPATLTCVSTPRWWCRNQVGGLGEEGEAPSCWTLSSVAPVTSLACPSGALSLHASEMLTV